MLKKIKISQVPSLFKFFSLFKKSDLLKLVKKYSHSEKGFAILFVLFVLMVLAAICVEILSQVELESSLIKHEKDLISAELSAESGVMFGRFVVDLNLSIREDQSIPTQAAPYVYSFYKALSGQIPFGKEAMPIISQTLKVDIKQILDSESLALFNAVPGSFIVFMESEDGKFNLNALRVLGEAKPLIQVAFQNILTHGLGQRLLESHGYEATKMRQDLEFYISFPTPSGGSFSDFESIGAKYKEKKAALLTLEELRRVPGFHIDEIYDVFSPYFTVWPLPVAGSSSLAILNINTISPELLAAIFNAPEDFSRAMKDVEKNRPFQSADYQSQLDQGQFLQRNMPLISNPQNESIFKNLFSFKDKTFKISARGSFENTEKKMESIIQFVPQGVGSPIPAGGAVLYARIF